MHTKQGPPRPHPRPPVPPTLVQTDDHQLVRHTGSNALLTTDKGALERHRAQRQKAQTQQSLQQRVTTLEEQVRRLEARLEGMLVQGQ